MSVENELPHDINRKPEKESIESTASRVGQILAKTALTTAYLVALAYIDIKLAGK